MAVFWVVVPCSLVEVYIRFRGPCCLHHQGDDRQTTQCCNPEDSHLCTHRRENLKSYRDLNMHHIDKKKIIFCWQKISFPIFLTSITRIHRSISVFTTSDRGLNYEPPKPPHHQTTNTIQLTTITRVIYYLFLHLFSIPYGLTMSWPHDWTMTLSC
jgi:hypothetical protein